MVVCRYFQRGTCRYKENCHFEHIYYGDGRNKSNYEEEKSISLTVAEDVLAAERGKQWLLSSYGPFKERPSIVGTEDVSPEEVRWQMYQAQKDGTVDQVKMQFQQMCQAAEAVRQKLKNPTPETAAYLENLQKENADSQNPFAASQMNNGTAPTNGIFGSSGNAFGGGFSSNSGTSVFSNSSGFGGNSAFSGSSGNSVFGNKAPTPGSIFGGGNTATSTVFNSMGQNTQQAFSGTPSVFGRTPQANFQNTGFSSGNQTNVFARPQTTQPSIFSSATSVPVNSVFSNQTSPGLFANNQMSQANPPGFGVAAPAAEASIFGQQKVTQGFGAALVFTNLGGAFNLSTANNASMEPGGNVFGGDSMVAAAQTPFAAATTATQSQFSSPPSYGVVGNTVPATMASPFGIAASTNYSPFVQKSAAGATVGQSGTFTSNSNPFGASPFAASAPIIDDSIFSLEEVITEAEKNAFLAKRFEFGKIPLQPPTKALK